MFVQVDLGENIAHRAEKLYISLTEVSPPVWDGPLEAEAGLVVGCL
jgi:hypothetical protein